MALDYSKLTTAELEAIANDDFSKLSNRTLRLISNEPEPKSVTDNIKDFGKATASLADTGLNAVTGMLDYAAYPLARAFGRSPEQATQETTSPKDVIGRGLGITQDPAYQSEASRRLMAGLGQGIENYAVKPLVSATGLPEQDVNSMVGSAMLGAGVKAQPYVNRVGQSVARGMYAAEPYITEALKAPVKAPVQFGKGLVEGLVNKEYNPATSAMVPLRDTYTPPPAAERFMGQAKTPPYKIGEGPSSGPLPNMPQQSLSQLQSQARPTSELVGGTAGRVAQAISPKTLAGETLVPLRGQGMQAFGERVGRGVRTNPLQAMGEVGLTALTGIPFKTLAQGIGEAGASYLGAKTGFMPGFSQQVGQAQGRAGIQSQMPQTPLLTNNPSSPGPVNPQTMFVSPEGVAGTNINQVSQAGAQQKYAPQPVAQTPQQMALQKTQEIVAQQAPTISPQQQAILDQIRARGKQQPAPTPTTQVAGPIAPTAIQSLSNQRWTPAEKLALERANLQNNPPPVISAVDETSMAKQVAESTKSSNEAIINDFATQGNSDKIDMIGQTIPVDKGKDAYNGSNATKGMANHLLKNGVDSIPVLDGMTESQTVHAIYNQMTGKGKNAKTTFTPEARTSKTINSELNSIDEQMTNLRDDALANGLKPNTPESEVLSKQLGELNEQAKTLQKELDAAKKAEKKTSKSAPKNVSKMMIGEPKATGPLEQSLVSKRSFNGDLQKYRYGTEKSPLTLQEYNHLKNSEFIDKQNTRDILMGMRPDLTEYSIWYKDKSGKIQNIQTYGDEFKKK